MSKLFVGIDVSKNSFDVCSINEEEKVVFNDKLNIDHNGFNNLLSKLKEYKIDDTIIVMESTAIYHLTLLSFLLTHNYKTAVINPFLIKSFIESNTLRKSKSDKKDALHIAKFALAKYKNISFYNIDSLESIKPLLREKENIVKDAGRAKTSIKNMVTQLFPELEQSVSKLYSNAMLNILYEYPSAKEVEKATVKRLDELLTNRTKMSANDLKELAKNSIGSNSEVLKEILKSKIRRLNSLNEELDRVDTLLEKYIQEDESTKKNKEILESIPGIGVGTSKSFLIELESIKRFSSVKKLSAFIGIDPSFYQSGQVYIQGSISRRGSKHLRRTLWYMAVGVIKSNKKFKEYYLKKRQEGKKYKQSVIAVANKLLRTIFILLTKQVLFDEEVAFAK